jgi:hypothetical protein
VWCRARGRCRARSAPRCRQAVAPLEHLALERAQGLEQPVDVGLALGALQAGVGVGQALVDEPVDQRAAGVLVVGGRVERRGRERRGAHLGDLGRLGVERVGELGRRRGPAERRLEVALGGAQALDAVAARRTAGARAGRAR